MHTKKYLSLLLLTINAYSYDSITSQEVGAISARMHEDFFSSDVSFFDWFRYYSPESYSPIDIETSKKELAALALEKCYNYNSRDKYGKKCTQKTIARRLSDKLINRAEQYTRNKVDGIPLDASTRTTIVQTISHAIKNELSQYIDGQSGTVTRAGFEKMISRYKQLKNKDYFDQKIDVMVAEEVARLGIYVITNTSVPTPSAPPAYEDVVAHTPFAPSAPPAYDEVVAPVMPSAPSLIPCCADTYCRADTLVLPKCNHAICRNCLTVLHRTAQEAGKLFSCPTCAKQYYHDDVKEMLRRMLRRGC